MTPQEEKEDLSRKMYCLNMKDHWSGDDYRQYEEWRTRRNELCKEIGGLPHTLEVILDKFREGVKV